MTKFTITDNLKDQLQSHNVPHKETIIERQWITTNDLLYIHKKYLSSTPLSQLLQNVKVYTPPKPKPSYTPEFKEQLDRLRYQLEEDEYQQLVNKDKMKIDDDYITPSMMAKEIRSQITTIFNILISVLSVVYAIWYWTSNEQVFKLHYRVLLCLFFGILILVAEVVVYNSYLRKIDEAKINEKKKREVTTVVDSVIYTGVNHNNDINEKKKNV